MHDLNNMFLFFSDTYACPISPPTPPQTPQTTGSYALVGKVNGKSHFFTTDNDSIAVYVLEGSDAKGWEIQPAGRLALPSYINPDGSDHLVRKYI